MKKSSNDWVEYKVSEIFKITRGIVIPKTDLSENKINKYIYPVYSSQTSNNGILGYDEKFDFDGKYLTWTTDGANAGKVFFRNGKFRCTNVCGVLYNDSNNYVNELTADLLNYETPKHVSYTGNPKLMNNIMGDIKVFLPDIDESDRVSNILLTVNNKFLLEKNKLSKLNELKNGLIKCMFI
jgi:putative type I restriction-modification enzyme, S subunit, ecoA family